MPGHDRIRLIDPASYQGPSAFEGLDSLLNTINTFAQQEKAEELAIEERDYQRNQDALANERADEQLQFNRQQAELTRLSNEKIRKNTFVSNIMGSDVSDMDKMIQLDLAKDNEGVDPGLVQRLKEGLQTNIESNDKLINFQTELSQEKIKPDEIRSRLKTFLETDGLSSKIKSEASQYALNLIATQNLELQNLKDKNISLTSLGNQLLLNPKDENLVTSYNKVNELVEQSYYGGIAIGQGDDTEDDIEENAEDFPEIIPEGEAGAIAQQFGFAEEEEFKTRRTGLKLILDEIRDLNTEIKRLKRDRNVVAKNPDEYDTTVDEINRKIENAENKRIQLTKRSLAGEKTLPEIF
tara:strand:+ start:517 stop:1575 length:1059 start_codon:yes stop_codon:yes gene_type:complete